MPRKASAVKVACVLCHERRVKCDRTEDVACSNCRNAQRDCEPIISRRGRKRKLPLGLSESAPARSSPQNSHFMAHEGVTPSTTHQVTPTEANKAPEKEPCFPALGPSGKTQYVGDSSNLNYLVQQFGNPFDGSTDTRPLQDHLHGAMLARVGDPTIQEIERLRQSSLARLKAEGAFDVPTLETGQALLDAYFHYSFTTLPILDRTIFLAQIKDGSVSHLLLNAVYLTASLSCSDTLISDAGFASRYAASLTFYRRAKSLYDAGFENDTIVTIQATLLMCHWWSGLLEPKDPWHWLGISVGMAQALGLHQAKSYIRLGERQRKLWRRLWWMIYTMDINLSMFLDRPPHVQGRLCNVPPLTEDDFEPNDDPDDSDPSDENFYNVSMFVINAMQLARIVDRFFTIKYDEDTGHSQDICLEQISLWSSSLPPGLQNLTSSQSIWAILTRILYQTYRLVLHRSNPRFSVNTGPGTPIFEICTDIYHMLEILMAKDLVYAAAGNIIASVLSVLSIQILNIHKGDSGVRMISEHRARFCMMILDNLQDRLPIIAAFLPIYESLLKGRSIGFQSQGGENTKEHPPGQSMQHEGADSENEMHRGSLNITEGLFDQIPQDNLGTLFPFSFPFGNLFEDVVLG
ncbi:unnamed protein product [Penicillium salamii]|uniref:Zn(2)-C6 fungal-type domain-containing protein n=1 Tax=Penicillium salamii TaxID=1612424 RepID=A0A9W4IIQ6_9EURO|nr:unnamed protein product [Penicillium salamii]CAG7964660.1 unnamed protein product [Penicillium salamii]CAG8019969.1 unnamed protein product [Penicillium salamii]CAG8087620.1 unnamed protein product [Penicillium salamii]CAG8105873.1 unnamed protein product [Penicillium salamii]